MQANASSANFFSSSSTVCALLEEKQMIRIDTDIKSAGSITVAVLFDIDASPRGLAQVDSF